MLNTETMVANSDAKIEEETSIGHATAAVDNEEAERKYPSIMPQIDQIIGMKQTLEMK